MIDRRSILLVSVLALVTVGISAAVYTQPADAMTIETNLQSEPLTLSAESPDGQVGSVNIEFAGTIEYSGFEHGVSEIAVYPPGDSYVYSPEDESASSGTLTISGDTDRTPSVSLPADYFGTPSVDEDGATQTTTRNVNVTVEVLGPDGEGAELGTSAEQRITREVTLEVTNLPDQNPSVNADLDWEGSIHMES